MKEKSQINCKFMIFLEHLRKLMFLETRQLESNERQIQVRRGGTSVLVYLADARGHW